MKPKSRFVLRVLLYSVPLYLVGQNLLLWYASALPAGLTRSGEDQHLPNNIGEFLYAPSMAVIAFCALILATPKMAALKKAGTLCVGLAVFVFADALFIRCLMVAAPLNADSVVFELYLCVKSLLACVLWIIIGYPYLGEVLGPEARRQTRDQIVR